MELSNTEQTSATDEWERRQPSQGSSVSENVQLLFCVHLRFSAKCRLCTRNGVMSLL